MKEGIEHYRRFMKLFVHIEKYDPVAPPVQGVLIDIINDDKLVVQHLKAPDKQWIVNIDDIKNMTGEPIKKEELNKKTNVKA